MNNFELTGIIRNVMNVQTFAKGFRKREFVLETGDKYPQKILFQLVQDKCDMIDSYDVGDTITVSFEVKGREWSGNGETKYFTTLEAWRLFGEKRAAATPSQQKDDDILNDLFPGNDGRTSNLSPEEADSEIVPPGSPEDDLPF